MNSAIRSAGLWLWLILLAGIPISSFPPVQATVGGETVSPFALLPLIPLAPIAFLQLLRRRSRAPAPVGLFLALLGLGLISTLLATFYPIVPIKGQSLVSRGIWGLGTLGVGAGFYLAGSVIVDRPRRLKLSIQAITVGALLALVWGTVQAWYVLDGIDVIPWQVNEIHRLFSVRDLFRDRVTSLAYEPSWFGNQMALLYMPLWLGLIANRESAFPKVLGFVGLEYLMLVWGAALLVLGESRLSLVSALLIVALALFLAAWRLSSRVVAWGGSRRLTMPRPLIQAALLSASVVLIIVVAFGAYRLLGSTDWRTRRLSTISREIYAIRDREPYEVGFGVADRLAFAERVVFWDAGLRVFERYPALGVGLGNSGFLLADTMSPYGWNLTEVRTALDPSNPSFPNTKSLWVRILSETGIVGFSAFMTWLLVVAASAVKLARSWDRGIASAGLAGVLAVASMALEGFSLETFALPQMWILPALVTALAWSGDHIRERGPDPSESETE